MKLKDISHKDLFRLLLGRLYVRYDLGGISARRSYQSELLEAVMHLFDKEDLQKEVDDEDVNFHVEVQKRWSKREIIPKRIVAYGTEGVLPFQNLSSLSNPELAFVVLVELCRWYKEDAERLGFQNTEHVRISESLKILCLIAYPCISLDRVNFIRGLHNGRELIEEGDSRTRRDIHSKGRLRDFAEFGINPWTDYSLR